MGYIIGRNTRVEVQKTLSAAIAISAISLALPAVASYEGAVDPSNGDVIVINDDIDGMFELAGQTVRLANVSSGGSPGSIELEGIDSSLYGALSGETSFVRVTAWATLGNAKTLSAGSTSPNKKDSTTLLDRKQRYLLGQPDTPDITVDMLSNPFLEAVALIKAASLTGAQLAFRVTCQDGSKRIFGGLVSLPSENITTGEIATGGFTIVQVGDRMEYAS